MPSPLHRSSRERSEGVFNVEHLSGSGSNRIGTVTGVLGARDRLEISDRGGLLQGHRTLDLSLIGGVFRFVVHALGRGIHYLLRFFLDGTRDVMGEGSAARTVGIFPPGSRVEGPGSRVEGVSHDHLAPWLEDVVYPTGRDGSFVEATVGPETQEEELLTMPTLLTLSECFSERTYCLNMLYMMRREAAEIFLEWDLPGDPPVLSFLEDATHWRGLSPERRARGRALGFINLVAYEPIDLFDAAFLRMIEEQSANDSHLDDSHRDDSHLLEGRLEYTRRIYRSHRARLLNARVGIARHLLNTRTHPASQEHFGEDSEAAQLLAQVIQSGGELSDALRVDARRLGFRCLLASNRDPEF